MTFFNFSPGDEAHSQTWIVSERFWIYWAVSIPLTVVVITSWLMWQKTSPNNSLFNNWK